MRLPVKLTNAFFPPRTLVILSTKCVVDYICCAYISVVSCICVYSGLISVKQFIAVCIIIHIQYRLTCKKYVLHRDLSFALILI